MDSTDESCYCEYKNMYDNNPEYESGLLETFYSDEYNPEYVEYQGEYTEECSSPLLVLSEHGVNKVDTGFSILMRDLYSLDTDIDIWTCHIACSCEECNRIAYYLVINSMKKILPTTKQCVNCLCKHGVIKRMELWHEHTMLNMYGICSTYCAAKVVEKIQFDVKHHIFSN